jgi:DNA-binding transcriptional ArsR family regulator
MPKKAEAPFENSGASKVFYQLLLDHTTPKEIASNLKIKPPTVVEHLRRLQNAGIVEIGIKKGKYQHYKINWKRFISEFLERVPTLVNYEVMLEVAPDLVKEKKEIEEYTKKQIRSFKKISKELEENEYFKKLIKGYFKGLTDLAEFGTLKLTLYDAIENFEDALRSVPLLKRRTKNTKLSRLFYLLEKWDKCSQEFKWYTPRAVFEDALEDLKK